MNLQQLRSMQEVVKQKLNVSRAAERLNVSQPVVTRHLQSLEDSLGVELFERNSRRLVRLTQAGSTLLPFIEQALGCLAEIRSVSGELASDVGKNVTIATVHTHGRLILPPAVRQMTTKYPQTRVRLLHGHRRQVADWVNSGEADFSVAPMPQEPYPDLIFIPCHEVHVAVLCPVGHVLAKKKRPLTLDEIGEHPIVTYDMKFSSRSEIERPFSEADLQMNVAITTTHADVVKQYVLAGFGIGLVADTAFDRTQDVGLRMIDARHLFNSTTVHLGIRRGGELSRYAKHLIQTLTPKLK
jgi:LysR family cys regulon transcriptional activator